MSIDVRNLRILVVAGARPNFVKIAPLMAQLRSKPPVPTDVLLVHTGQHYDDAMSTVFFDQLGIPRPDVNLEVGSGSHGRQTAEIILRFEPVVTEWKPDVVMVVGDVNSTIACGLVATKLGIRVAHVEAGLRSFDRNMPEEINRVLTDSISDYLFVTEPSGVANLRREGVDERKIFLVGNVMIDSLRAFLPRARETSILRELGLVSENGAAERPKPYVLLTLHRPSNVDDPAKLGPLLRLLGEIGEHVPVIFPAHPRTKSNIQRFGLADTVRSGPQTAEPGLWILPPSAYLDFLHLMSEASLVLTDSGGIQEETTALGVPCLTLRDNTERPVTVDEGTNVLVGTNPDTILREARTILAGKGKNGRVPALWDGRAAERIVEILLDRLQRDGAINEQTESAEKR
jgi:UDP-N-acetylglucosamine 2-epimerase (non-hydrolysing)